MYLQSKAIIFVKILGAPGPRWEWRPSGRDRRSQRLRPPLCPGSHLSTCQHVKLKALTPICIMSTSSSLTFGKYCDLRSWYQSLNLQCSTDTCIFGNKYKDDPVSTPHKTGLIGLFPMPISCVLGHIQHGDTQPTNR